MTSLTAPSFGRWMPWMMQRWPRLTHGIVEFAVQHADDARRDVYRQRTREAMQAVGVHDARIEEAACRLPAQFIADVARLRHASESVVASLPMTLTDTSVQRLRGSLVHGRGVVMGCSNFGCFYQAMLAGRGVIDDLLIVVGHVAEGDQPFRRRLERLAGARIRLVGVDSRSAFAIARQLERGGVVATMLDTCMRHSKPLIVPFLGRPAISPAGIYQLVSRQGAEIVPVFALRRREGLEVTFGEPIDGLDCDPVTIATRVNVQIGSQILAEPGQWMMWPTLLDRWAAAEQPA